jgi:hypothetical protein
MLRASSEVSYDSLKEIGPQTEYSVKKRVAGRLAWTYVCPTSSLIVRLSAVASICALVTATVIVIGRVVVVFISLIVGLLYIGHLVRPAFVALVNVRNERLGSTSVTPARSAYHFGQIGTSLHSGKVSM